MRRNTSLSVEFRYFTIHRHVFDTPGNFLKYFKCIYIFFSLAEEYAIKIAETIIKHSALTFSSHLAKNEKKTFFKIKFYHKTFDKGSLQNVRCLSVLENKSIKKIRTRLNKC